MFQWSFTKLKQYEACPHRITLMQAHSPESNEALQRGIKIHSQLEQFVNTGDNELIKDMPFKTQLHNLHKNKAKTEVKLAIDKNWQPTEWKTAWGRAILDVLESPNEQSIWFGDYKTGSKRVIAHTDAACCYAAFVHVHYPQLNLIKVDYLYMDTGETLTIDFNTNHIQQTIIPRFNKRLTTWEKDKKFSAKPSKWNCKFCQVAKHCEQRYDD